MKKLHLFLCLFFVVLIFSACAPKVKTEDVNASLNLKICGCLENVEDVNSLSKETIKALSVIFRTNIINGNINSKESSDSKFLNLVEKTNGEVLIVKDSKKLNLTAVPEDYSWNREIKKADLLLFLSKNNISLANIKNIEPIFDQDKNLISLSVGGKIIDYYTLKDHFGLESSKITNIKLDKENNSIIISGKGKDLDALSFDLTLAQKLSEDGKNYKQLLNHFFGGFEIKTI